MTIIKQGGVSSKSHQRNLRAYINDDKKVLLRDSQNMEECKGMIRPPVASATGRPAS